MQARASATAKRSIDVLKRHPRELAIGGGAAGLIAIVLIVSAISYVISLGRGLPDQDAVKRIGVMAQSTAVYDVSDKLAFTIYKEQRIDVPLSEVSPHLIRAVVAIEDQRFYDHHGFDPQRILSAAFADLRHVRAAQGGSTITQQLARQSFLTPDKTLRRKLQELILAERIERVYSKDEILHVYLNKVYFGDGLYGVEAASRGFFGKHASDLTVSEAALLAGLVKSPSTYAPTINLQRSIARRNVMLQAMLDSGAIDKATWHEARASKVVLRDDLRSDEPHGLYFKEQVRRELVDRFGWQRVSEGGLRVFSTIDMRMQEAAEAAVMDSLKALEDRRRAIAARRLAAQRRDGTADQGPASPQDAQPLQAALIALDPATGHVRAIVGGRDFNESSFNRAIQARRQPGSAFKPFVYATAIEAGYSPASIIDRLNDPIATVQGDWTPEDEHSSATEMTLRTGLRTSSNRAAVRLLQEVGIPRTVEYARSLGVGNVPSVPSLALGSGVVTLESMTAAYAAFANHGLVPHPLFIRRVEDRDGRLLYQADETSTPAISDTTAFLMSSMMADVVNAGTGARARQFGFTLPAAGKTGTTNDFNDAWFVGFTPRLVAGVWVGFDQPRTIFPNGFAADVAVPMWARFMKPATRTDPPQWFSVPSGMTTATVCRLSGKLATEGCKNVEVVDDKGHADRRSMVYTEYFVRGTEPIAYCDLHGTRNLFGKIAGLVGVGVAKPAPLRVEEAALPPAPAAGSTGQAAPPPPPPTVEEPKKKRGFWSRLFGVGKDDQKAPGKDDQKTPKKKGGG